MIFDRERLTEIVFLSLTASTACVLMTLALRITSEWVAYNFLLLHLLKDEERNVCTTNSISDNYGWSIPVEL